jgi:hypothetical protein
MFVVVVGEWGSSSARLARLADDYGNVPVRGMPRFAQRPAQQQNVKSKRNFNPTQLD